MHTVSSSLLQVVLLIQTAWICNVNDSLLGVDDRWLQSYGLVHNSSHLHSGLCWSMVHESMSERATGAVMSEAL